MGWGKVVEGERLVLGFHTKTHSSKYLEPEKNLPKSGKLITCKELGIKIISNIWTATLESRR